MTSTVLNTLLMTLLAQPQLGQPTGCVADPVQPGGPIVESRFFEVPHRRTRDALEDAMKAAGVLLYESSDFRFRGERVVNNTVPLGLPGGDEMVLGRLEVANRDGRSGTLVQIETLRQGGKAGVPKQSWSTAILDITSCLLTTLDGGERASSQAMAPLSSTNLTESRKVVLAGGTPVALLLRRFLDYDDLRLEKKILFEAASDISVGPDVVIRRGAVGQATVTEFVAAKAGFWKTEAPQALIRFDYVTAVSGQRVPLDGQASLHLKRFTTMTRSFSGAAWRAGTRFEASVSADQPVRLARHIGRAGLT